VALAHSTQLTFLGLARIALTNGGLGGFTRATLSLRRRLGLTRAAFASRGFRFAGASFPRFGFTRAPFARLGFSRRNRALARRKLLGSSL
jgi:hypothetical protein